MPYETVIYEKKEGVAIITLNRPEKRNALSQQLSQELGQAVNEAIKDNEVRVVVVTGGPKAFCAGADLSEVAASRTGRAERTGPSARDLLLDMPKPSIAAISGPCVAGGLELAMACDIRIASETARIGDGHAKMGLLGPSTAILPRLVGVGMAKELIFTGDLVDGNEACRIGFVNHVYPEDKFLDEAIELAKRMAKNTPATLRLSKKAIDMGILMTEREAVHHSGLCTAELLASAEYKERVGAFLKR